MSLVLQELAEIEQRNGEAAVAEVRKAAHLLLRKQFLFSGDRGTAQAYNTLCHTRYRAYFSALFDAVGYSFRLNDAEQWIGLLPDPEIEMMPRMRLEQTIILLLLAAFWQERVNHGDVGHRAVVLTTVNDLFDRYRDMVGRIRKESLSVGRIIDILKEFERRSLVRLGAFDQEQDDFELEIRPMVNLLVESRALDRLEAFARDGEALAPAEDQSVAADNAEEAGA